MNVQLAIYQAIVHAGAIAWLLYLFARYSPLEVSWFDLAFWLGFGLISHAIQFDALFSRGQALRISVGFASSMACIILFSPPLAAVLVALNSFSLRDLTGRNEWYKIVFNRSMFVLCAGVGGVAYQTFDQAIPFTGTLSALAAGLGTSGIYYLVNWLLVTLVIAYSSGRSPWVVWNSARSTATQISYFTLGAMGTSLALVYQSLGPLGVLVLGVTLVASYYSLRNSTRVSQFYTQIVQSLSDSLDLREHETAGHTRRIALSSRRVARALGLRGHALETIYMGGLLHDLGKLGMPDDVLLKPGLLTSSEWERARQHPVEGAKLLEPYEHLREVRPIVRHHHEHYDGSGYPDSLTGDQIPIGARIVSVVDAFDAMYFGRPYRPPIPLEEAYEEISRNGGTQFDPRVVEVFLEIDWPRELPLLLSEEQQSAND